MVLDDFHQALKNENKIIELEYLLGVKIKLIDELTGIVESQKNLIIRLTNDLNSARECILSRD